MKNIKKTTIRVLMTLIGTLIVSVSINALYLPRNILSGGITGIAILLNLSFGCGISWIIILLNIPIFFIGYKHVNREFIIYSLIGMLSLTGFIAVTKGVSFHSENLLTAILFGGILNGFGFGLIFRANSSTGGNDILSKVLNRKYSYSIATLNFGFNVLIIGLSAFVFGIDIAVETLTTMYVSAMTVRFVLEGSNYKRTVFIITDHKEAVANEINLQLSRGCTIMEGTGSYTGNKRDVLYAVISVNQVSRLKMIVSEIDENAFINVIETRVVFGNGFLNLADKE